jgi:hypothetical protein
MFFDVIVNLNTGIFVNGKIVKDRIHIIDFYIRTVFLGDFLSLLALIIDSYDMNNKSIFLIIFFLFQINKV